jgi:hypothetical protein
MGLTLLHSASNFTDYPAKISGLPGVVNPEREVGTIYITGPVCTIGTIYTRK